MALSLGQTGTADSIDADYLTQDQSDFPVRIQMHREAIDGIARDVGEASVGSGGLLLGHVEPGARCTVWIDRYHRIPEDDADHHAFEDAATSISQDSELAVVGFYRLRARGGFELTEPDLDLVRRYFTDDSDLILLVRSDRDDVSGCFLAAGRTAQPFAFRGRADVSEEIQPDTARTHPPKPEHPAEHLRWIVPDFAQAEPPKQVLRDLPPRSEALPDDTLPDENTRSRKWLPFAAAVALVGVALAFIFLPSMAHRETAAASVSAPIRPLGLYVDPSGDSWRVSWNPAGTAFQGARTVSLFVRDGEDQNRIDLTPADRRAGTYQYQPKTADVTFRLEVAEADGHISAESFRFMKSPPALVATTPATAPAPAGKTTSPRAVRKVAPVVPASIRPRIRGSIPIDVRVAVDAAGRVTSAVPASKHNGLQAYLAERAVVAARQWRFEPGAPGTETIHFVFDR